MLLKRLSKYIPLYGGNGMTGLLELDLKDFSSQLKVTFTFTQIRKTALFENIAGALEQNPSNYALVKTLDREIRKTYEFTQLECIQVKSELQECLNVYLTTPSQPIGSDVLINCIPGLVNFRLTYEKTYILYNFVDFFVTNYEMLQVKLYSNKKEMSDKQELELSEPIGVGDPNIQSMDGQKADLFTEMMSNVNLSQPVKVFIAKQILMRDFAVFVNEEANTKGNKGKSKIVIKHIPLYDFNLWRYSPVHTNDLVTILNSIKENNLIEIAARLKTLTRQIYYLIGDSYKGIESTKVGEYNITITCLLFLIYIYSLKIVENKFIKNVLSGKIESGNNYLETVNVGIAYIIDKFGLNGDVNDLVIEYAEESTTSTAISDRLTGVIAEYQYLNTIDRDLFKTEVFGSLFKTEDDSELKSRLAEDCVSVNKPTILNIDDFRMKEVVEMTTKEIFKYVPINNLSYVTSSNSIFTDRKVISIPYAQVLLIQYDGTNRMFMLDNNPIKLYIDIVLNRIFPEMDKQKFLAENISSVFQIYQHFISPFVPNKVVTNKTVQFLLFQIIIPYLYDTMGMRKVIDNFH